MRVGGRLGKPTTVERHARGAHHVEVGDRRGHRGGNLVSISSQRTPKSIRGHGHVSGTRHVPDSGVTDTCRGRGMYLAWTRTIRSVDPGGHTSRVPLLHGFTMGRLTRHHTPPHVL